MSLQSAAVTVNLQFEGLQNNRPLYLPDIFAKSRHQINLDVDEIVKWHTEMNKKLYEAFKSCLTEKGIGMFGLKKELEASYV